MYISINTLFCQYLYAYSCLKSWKGVGLDRHVASRAVLEHQPAGQPYVHDAPFHLAGCSQKSRAPRWCRPLGPRPRRRGTHERHADGQAVQAGDRPEAERDNGRDEQLPREEDILEVREAARVDVGRGAHRDDDRDGLLDLACLGPVGVAEHDHDHRGGDENHELPERVDQAAEPAVVIGNHGEHAGDYETDGATNDIGHGDDPSRIGTAVGVHVKRISGQRGSANSHNFHQKLRQKSQ